MRRNAWTPIATIGNKRLQFGVAVLDDKLFIVGGRDGLKTLNTVDCFDPKTKEKTAVTPMNIHRHGLGVGVLGGPLYAVGGHDGWSYLNSVERYMDSGPSRKLPSLGPNLQFAWGTFGADH